MHLHPADAAARNLTDGDRVVVHADGTGVTTTVAVSDRVRERTAALHASVADPLVRRDVEDVRVRGQGGEAAPPVDVESSGE
ncbi:MAG: molybdopterin dinucleotide binding domain-containing protein [Halobacterium sp.]